MPTPETLILSAPILATVFYLLMPRKLKIAITINVCSK